MRAKRAFSQEDKIKLLVLVRERRLDKMTNNNTDDNGGQIRKAPIATSGNNIYIAWWTNKTGNDEVMFRASTDGGKTFGDKINLSNSTYSDIRIDKKRAKRRYGIHVSQI